MKPLRVSLNRAKKPTARERVEDRFPSAYGWRDKGSGNYEIWVGTLKMASDPSPSRAWWIAAQKL